MFAPLDQGIHFLRWSNRLVTDSREEGDARGSPSTEYMEPAITNDGFLSVTSELSDMKNGDPRHLQNFQSQYPLAGIEWYSCRLDRGVSTSTGFIESAIPR